METAFLHISSAISAHQDLNRTLEVIARESLNCLRANRSTIFLIDPKSGNLKPRFTHALDPLDERVGLFEESELAQKALQHKKPFLVGGRGKVANLSKGQEHERKVISLMNFPLSAKGDTVGVASLVLINEENGFDEKNMRLFSSFANLASIAMEMSHLPEGALKGESSGISNNRRTENVPQQPPTPPEKESQRTDMPNFGIRAEEKVTERPNLPEGAHKGESSGISNNRRTENVPQQPQKPPEKKIQRSDAPAVKMRSEQKVEEQRLIEGLNQEKIAWAPGTVSLKEEESGIERRTEERVETNVRAEFQEEYWAYTKNLSKGGAFIVTSTPFDLGDKMLLKLHLPDGGEELQVDCKVVWTNQYGRETQDLRRGMGVKFLKLQPEAQMRIQAYIESQKNRNLRQDR
jgi:uncharacterized protein (TIGR02266 family)